jgi:hypothetical protein
MELTQRFETSAATHRTPGKFPEDYLLHWLPCFTFLTVPVLPEDDLL